MKAVRKIPKTVKTSAKRKTVRIITETSAKRRAARITTKMSAKRRAARIITGMSAKRRAARITTVMSMKTREVRTIIVPKRRLLRFRHRPRRQKPRRRKHRFHVLPIREARHRPRPGRSPAIRFLPWKPIRSRIFPHRRLLLPEMCSISGREGLWDNLE